MSEHMLVRISDGWVNPSQITAVVPHEDGSRVWLTDGRHVDSEYAQPSTVARVLMGGSDE